MGLVWLAEALTKGIACCAAACGSGVRGSSLQICRTGASVHIERVRVPKLLLFTFSIRDKMRSPLGVCEESEFGKRNLVLTYFNLSCTAWVLAGRTSSRPPINPVSLGTS